MSAARFALAFGLIGAFALPAAAQVPSLSEVLPAGEGSAAGRLIQMMALVTVLSVAPGILVMTTSFTRFVIAFSFLRAGLGLQSTPSNLILASLALFMTAYVMQPTFDRAWREGLQPLLANQITEEVAAERIVAPFREFMERHVRQKDLALLEDLRLGVAEGDPAPDAAVQPPGSPDLRVLIPAFMMSELRRGFEIGFLIVLPFLVIDMIVATIVMSMGMMMMPPSVVALPFKVLFFVLIDGWNILVASLVRSYS